MLMTYYTQKSKFYFAVMLPIAGIFVVLTWMASRTMVMAAHSGYIDALPPSWDWSEPIIQFLGCWLCLGITAHSLLTVWTTALTDRYVSRRGLLKKHRMYWREVVSVVANGTSIVLESRRDRLRFAFTQFPDAEQLMAIIRHHTAPEVFEPGQERSEGESRMTEFRPGGEHLSGPQVEAKSAESRRRAYANAAGDSDFPKPPSAGSAGARPVLSGGSAPAPLMWQDATFGWFMRSLAVGLAMVIATKSLAVLAWRLWHGAPPFGSAGWVAGSSVVLLLLLPRRYWWRVFVWMVAMAGVILLVAKR